MRRGFTLGMILAVATLHPVLGWSQDVESLEEKVKILEERQAELYHSLKEKKEFDFVGNISDKISLGGLIEVEAAFVDDEAAAPNEDSSDITLATVELGIDAKINENVDGHLLFLYEEDETDFDIDEGTITITSPYGLYLTAGKMYVPFGAFNSHFITDPLTLDLGETNESAVLLGRSSDLYDFSVVIYNGGVDETGDDDEIDDIVASFTVNPAEGVSFGASYISDIADSDAEIAGATIADSVAGIGLFLSLTYGPFAVEAEYVGATDDFTAAEVAGSAILTGSEPSAYNIELAYTVNEDFEVALRFEGSDDLGWVEDRFGLAGSFGIYENTTISLEYLHGEYQNNQEVDSMTAQLALEF